MTSFYKIDYRLYLLTTLCSVAFFNPFGILPDGRFPIHLYELLIVLSSLFAFSRKTKINIPKKYVIIYYFFLISCVLSLFMALKYHSQSLSQSIFSTFPIFGSYLYFLVLLKFNIPILKLLKTIKFLLILSAIVYLVNFLFQPIQIFQWGRYQLDSNRGVARLWIPFIELHVLSLYYHIYLYTKHNRHDKSIFWIVLSGIMILLSVTRQTILLSAILGAWIFMRNLSLSRKLFYTIILSVPIWFFTQTTFFQNLLSISEKQVVRTDNFETDIRMKAFTFFTEEAQANDFTKIFGNGVFSTNSEWGASLHSESMSKRCFLADIGWTGIFYYFGWFGFLSLLLFMLFSILKKKEKDKQYLSFWLFHILITSIVSAPVTYHYQILSISLVLYLVYKDNQIIEHI